MKFYQTFHNTKLEKKQNKTKQTNKKNHAKVFFTKNYMFDTKEIKHCWL
jgi:hypothetical protein